MLGDPPLAALVALLLLSAAALLAQPWWVRRRRAKLLRGPFPPAWRRILQRRVPGIGPALAAQIVAFVQKLRSIELTKLPGIAETIEWTRALMELDAMVLDPEVIQHTLGVLLKYQDDIARMQGGEAARILAEVNEAVRTGQA